MSSIVIKSQEKKFPVAPHLYGLFYEDINRSGDGGLYPEMLRNRSFEDSIPPERCAVTEDRVSFTTPKGWSDQFNNGEGLKKWMDNTPSTPIPAWYADNAVMSLDDSDTLNPKRLVSLKADFKAGGSIFNTGFNGLPLKAGSSYVFYTFAKACETPVTLKISIASAAGSVQDEVSFTVEPDAYNRYDCTFTAVQDDFESRLVITSPEASSVNFGFTSLMPSDTYKGHGMRKDLMEMLAGTNSKFFRFPGGCIVEGFTYETAMRFPNTIGPVWERPSHILMWHYRTSNGLGFHEYLQICEDLDLEPMYVINCGLTCQGRGPELFEGEDLEKLLQEAFDAIEYAIGDISTPMGKKRAEAGHPKPFKMTYIEIGNENSGPDYFTRYKKFYDALKARYPKIKYISNTHTERDGLPTEIADEHYYNNPEFFAENVHRYDDYDRNGPDIFVGEYAVNSGVKPGTLRCALGEAMFLTGVENNQDIVTMTAYAPLFENVDFSAWKPNLISFDNHRVYGIPTYHMISMMAGNRGSEVVASTVDAPRVYRDVSGMPGLMSAKGGMSFRNAKLNGNPVSVYKEVQGGFTQNGGEHISVSSPITAGSANRPGMEAMGNIVFAVLGNVPSKLYEFEVEVKSKQDSPITIAVWCHRPMTYFNIDETAGDIWNMRSVRHYDWTVQGSVSAVSQGNFNRRIPLGEDTAISVNLEEYNTYKVVTREDGFDCYINGSLVQRAYIPYHFGLSATAAAEDDYIILKIVNIKDDVDDISITLDCPLKPDYQALVLTARDQEAVNSLEAPLSVAPVAKALTGAAQEFIYRAPAHSLNILRVVRA